MADFWPLGLFGDRRRAERGAWLFERIVATGSLVIRQIGEDRAGEIAAHRFLSSPEVTPAEIIETLSERTAARCAGRTIVAVQDTTEINYGGRDLVRRGLGCAGNGRDLGFFIHPVIAVDAADEAVVGLLDAQIWTRDQDNDGSACRDRRKRKLAEKESGRWLEGVRQAAARCTEADRLIVVGDRESDIYSVFAQCPEGVDLVVRASQNRVVEEYERLFSATQAWSVLDVYAVPVPSRGPGDKGRTAVVRLKAGTVEIKRPRNGADPADPESVTLTLVDVEEVEPPTGTTPLHWRLLSTLPATDAKSASEIVRLYRLRWRIEQTFRALKSDGLALEEVQMQEASRLFKLAALGLAAAVRTIQLVDARDGGPRQATDVAGPDLIKAAAAIGPTLERKTERQKNPHPPKSLPWLSWIVARLGGWNCYYKPPGPKTMRAGWDRLAAMAEGYFIAQSQT
ncbi:MAG: IS4 family transposase [Aliidongia sp.]